MFVRVERTRRGMRVETCPISGTIARGSDPLEDAQQIKKLIMNSKGERTYHVHRCGQKRQEPYL